MNEVHRPSDSRGRQRRGIGLINGQLALTSLESGLSRFMQSAYMLCHWHMLTPLMWSIAWSINTAYAVCVCC